MIRLIFYILFSYDNNISIIILIIINNIIIISNKLITHLTKTSLRVTKTTKIEKS